MGLKKSYIGLIAWVICFLGSVFLCTLLPLGEDLLVCVVHNVLMWQIVILAYIIYRTENVYWYNGISYEAALEAGFARRKIYAFKHFLTFGIVALVFLVVSLIMQVLSAPTYAELIVFVVILMGGAITTVRFKL